ncbi:hypothetical protein HDV00_000586 [Rhizophlyctis rosea]|nr:hypothetical protein HDV00_000586 [Rhizophlyctis rosea]
MPTKKRFIDPKKSVHFQLVHRSQRDPELANDEASQYVLKPVPPSKNLVKKGKYDLDQLPDTEDYLSDDHDLDDDDFDSDEGWEDDEAEYLGEEDDDEEERPRPQRRPVETKKQVAYVAPKEEASMHGIYFADQDSYNYLQHLKPIGQDPSAVFVEAKSQKKDSKKPSIQFLDTSDTASQSTTTRIKNTNFSLPSEALPSAYEERVGMLARGGELNQIDIDPSMREVMYALDDEAYVEDAEELDEFFGAFGAEEVSEDMAEELGLEFERREGDADWGEEEGEEGEDGEREEDPWKEFKKFQKQTETTFSDEDDDASLSSHTDATPRAHHSRPPRSTTALTAMTGMSAISMNRSEHLVLVDDRFDQIEREYDDENIGELDAEDPEVRGDNLLSLERFNGVMDDFLESTMTMGKRKRVVDRREPVKQMDEVRGMLKGDAREAVERELAGVELAPRADGEGEEEELEMDFRSKAERRKEVWDVETVLTTYSNIYNHPKLISEVARGVGRIKLKGRMGMPVVEGKENDGEERGEEGSDSEGEDEGDEEDGEKVNKGAKREKGETKEEKKARKEAVKAERRNRRTEKKATKTAFKEEKARQSKTIGNKRMQEGAMHLA